MLFRLFGRARCGGSENPNRVGYLAMGSAIDLNLLAPIPVTRR